jgi:C4-dicarboxylate transporter, DctM subunit
VLTTTIFGATLAALIGGSILGLSMAAIGLVVLYVSFSGNLSALANGTWNIFNSFTLTAVPMFILLGELIGVTGVAQRIYTGLNPLFRRLPGGLLQTNIGICAAFGAISGSSTATSAVVGAIAYNQLVARGYDRAAVSGSIAAGGTLGILIPPSIPMVIYASMTDTSVGHLFVAGIIPGLVLTALFMVYIAALARFSPGVAPREASRETIGAALIASLQAWPFVVLIAAVMGSIMAGLATSTESAALGVAAALALAAFYRELTWARVWRAVRNTTIVYGALALIVVGASILSQAVALTGAPQKLLALLNAGGFTHWQIVTLVYIVYFILGIPLGAIEMLLLTVPFTVPLMAGLGYDPVWFGVALVILIEVALLSPPVGMNLFVVMSISKGAVSLGEVSWATVPYWIIMLLFLGFITFYTDLVLFLPRLVFS